MIERVYAAFLLLIIAPCYSLADIGNVTVNGQTIRPILFKGYAIHFMLKQDICPPLSDASIRDTVVDWHLLVQEGKRLNITRSQRDIDTENEYIEELASMPADAPEKTRAKAEILRLHFAVSGYMSAMKKDIVEQEIIAEYERLVAWKNPRLVDVVVVLRTELDLESEGDVKEAKKLLAAGQSFDKVAQQLDPDYMGSLQEKEWMTLDRMRGYKGNGSDFETGDVIGPYKSRFYWTLIHIREKKVLSRIRPVYRINYTDSYAKREVELKLIGEQRDQIFGSIRRKADVREDGVKVNVPKKYPKCSADQARGPSKLSIAVNLT